MATISRRKVLGGAVGLAFATAASKVVAADSKKSASTKDGKLDINMVDMLKFEPAEIKAKPGDKLTFINKGFMQHDAKSDDKVIGEMCPLVDPGKKHEFTVPAKAEKGKTYEFYCTVAGHKEGGMKGKLIIE